MAYSPSLADATSRVRFAVQDTDDAAPLLPEATYTALIGIHDDSEERATVAAAEALLTKYAQQPDKVEITGALKAEWSSRLAAWRALANGLRAQLGLPILGATDSTMHVGQFVRTTGGGEFGG